jgi:hypothetical protein
MRLIASRVAALDAEDDAWGLRAWIHRPIFPR